ncbi:MAG: tRNA (adenosine(37)-N6)-dimethylallyltransferase MiaA [Thermus sp.]|uniref:tRNA (adenosine(37)-N6)-dimethylallyltransferase MiaA n=1 Tax=Thermus sp. TaxID=275 RepID=UPI0025E94FCA|nr:tRNA (adenosine(37)-N6)-dimethylallyltransferase MiaA [Thermus sp.]MCS6869264.1 tRNA (adenosine(37)-N6)-dimethylallyltransferase MiaA [Thermus sp.]MCS7219053.1 tRNA (adenosine(37)-N6)-dimethylallyltransferase MiaA [Thermus sp.]MCX7849033.1 tRNA (adenosine(37)-N6)-dimethylallyltransferase MiaA [Thermus sp.]MDW8357308.1 tRNA (adenosine(37)-N6)-dimethylallyltransferase MiaA [Thermus sp.]
MERIPVLAGPTGSGKTLLALRLGEEMPVEVVSADATMVYRGLDVGTDKPSPEERRRVPHHLVDVLEPSEAMSVARWVAMAEAAIAEVLSRGRLPLVVGGTGYYIRALSEGLPGLPPPDPEVQAALWQELEAKGLEPLQAELARASLEDALRVGKNPRRLVRALEVLRRTGTPPARFPRRPPRFGYAKLVLWPERAWLFPKLEARARRQFAQGLVEEVRALLARYPGMPTALQAIGYKEVVGYLKGEYGLEEAILRDIRAVKAYAKRQYTWFRHEPGEVVYLPRGGEEAYRGFRDWLRLHFGL